MNFVPGLQHVSKPNSLSPTQVARRPAGSVSMRLECISGIFGGAQIYNVISEPDKGDGSS